MLQIKRGFEDSSKIIVPISQTKIISFDPSGRRFKEGGGGSKRMFSLKNMEHYLQIITVTPSYLEH